MHGRDDGSPGSEGYEDEHRYIKLSNFLPSILRHLAETISVKLSKSYNGEQQLTVTEWRILLQLAQHRSLHAMQIVENTTMEKSKVSRALSSMQAEGIVLRQTDPQDNRRQLLQLTDYGSQIFTNLVPQVLDWEKDLIACYDASEYRDLLYLLNKLRLHLQTMD